jgi:6-phosphogluconate dehydrogenase (decarboxylating)
VRKVLAQGPYLRRVHPTIQWAMLEALAEGATIASRNLGLEPAAV